MRHPTRLMSSPLDPIAQAKVVPKKSQPAKKAAPASKPASKKAPASKVRHPSPLSLLRTSLMPLTARLEEGSCVEESCSCRAHAASHARPIFSLHRTVQAGEQAPIDHARRQEVIGSPPFFSTTLLVPPCCLMSFAVDGQLGLSVFFSRLSFYTSVRAPLFRVHSCMLNCSTCSLFFRERITKHYQTSSRH